MMQHKLLTILIGLGVVAVLGVALGDDPSTQDAGGSGSASTDVSPQDSLVPEPPPDLVEMPAVAGLSLAEARSELAALGLDVTVREKYSREKANTVLRSDSTSGKELEEGAGVELVVAEPYPTVPRVVGKSKANAVNQLKKAGYRVDVKTQESSKPAGTVIALRPHAGTGLLPGKTVTIVVAKKPPTTSGGDGTCTPGYSPCLPPASDYDCYGGSGDGPAYTDPGVTYRVTGSDPYGLDADGDGYGCE